MLHYVSFLLLWVCLAGCAVVLLAWTVLGSGAALKKYEALEMWDQIITCYQLLGKKAMAHELIQRRLTVGVTCLHSACSLASGMVYVICKSALCAVSYVGFTMLACTEALNNTAVHCAVWICRNALMMQGYGAFLETLRMMTPATSRHGSGHIIVVLVPSVPWHVVL